MYGMRLEIPKRTKMGKKISETMPILCNTNEFQCSKRGNQTIEANSNLCLYKKIKWRNESQRPDLTNSQYKMHFFNLQLFTVFQKFKFNMENPKKNIYKLLNKTKTLYLLTCFVSIYNNEMNVAQTKLWNSLKNEPQKRYETTTNKQQKTMDMYVTRLSCDMLVFYVYVDATNHMYKWIVWLETVRFDCIGLHRFSMRLSVVRMYWCLLSLRAMTSFSNTAVLVYVMVVYWFFCVIVSFRTFQVAAQSSVYHYFSKTTLPILVWNILFQIVCGFYLHIKSLYFKILCKKFSYSFLRILFIQFSLKIWIQRNTKHQVSNVQWQSVIYTSDSSYFILLK